MALAETNAQAFYVLLQENLEQLLPVLYTPTVGDACLAWGRLLPVPRTCLYLSAFAHRGHVRALLDAWPYRQARIAVITDGERILGLGDLGVHGMGIPVGKAVVYGGCGVDPRWVLPVCVDVGCDTPGVRDDPLYLGTRRPRLRDDDGYFSFMDEVVAGIQASFGRPVLVHWEDVGRRHSGKLLDRLRASGVAPTFNDDIEATAAVVLAALLGAQSLPGVAPLAQQTFLLFGAGQTALGCAGLITAALREEGLSSQEAAGRIWLVDSQGLVLRDRAGLPPDKRRFAQDPAALPPGWAAGGETKPSLAEIVRAVRPTTLIGTASVGGAFDQAVITALVEAAERGQQAAARPILHAALGDATPARPTVLALSNPTSRAECSFRDAHEWSGGRVVFASGTRFPGLEVGARALQPSQCNNCYVFPGIGLGWAAAGAADVTPAMLLAAAQAVAGCTRREELATTEAVLPTLSRLPEVTLAVARAVAAAAAVDMVAASTRDACPTAALAAAASGSPAALDACLLRMLFRPRDLTPC